MSKAVAAEADPRMVAIIRHTGRFGPQLFGQLALERALSSKVSLISSEATTQVGHELQDVTLAARQQ